MTGYSVRDELVEPPAFYIPLSSSSFVYQVVIETAPSGLNRASKRTWLLTLLMMR
jgi:hypothetical protein